ncbi:hypothetical protein MRX96_012253 [Rhipicephalus microplus]
MESCCLVKTALGDRSRAVLLSVPDFWTSSSLCPGLLDVDRPTSGAMVVVTASSTAAACCCCASRQDAVSSPSTSSQATSSDESGKGGVPVVLRRCAKPVCGQLRFKKLADARCLATDDRAQGGSVDARTCEVRTYGPDLKRC